MEMTGLGMRNCVAVRLHEKCVTWLARGIQLSLCICGWFDAERLVNKRVTKTRSQLMWMCDVHWTGALIFCVMSQKLEGLVVSLLNYIHSLGPLCCVQPHLQDSVCVWSAVTEVWATWADAPSAADATTLTLLFHTHKNTYTNSLHFCGTCFL